MSPNSKIIDRKKIVVHLLLLTISLYVLSLYFMSTELFFSNDNGLRYLQIQELAHNQRQSFSVSYPARYLAPELEYTPFYYAYAVIEEEIYFSISAFLPLITSWFYPALELFALPIFPVLGGVLIAAAIFSLGRLIHVKRPFLLLWAAVLATPVLFYSLQLWDHTMGVACALWSLVGLAYGLQTGRWTYAFLGGLALGFGFGQRPEIYVFALAFGLVAILVAWKRWRVWGAMLAGAVLMALFVWGLQWLWTGHPLGMSVAPNLFGYGVPETYAFTPEGLPRNIKLSWFILYVQGQDPYSFLSALSILVGIFLIFFSLRMPSWQKSWVFVLALATLGLGYTILFWRSFPEPIPGLFSTLPLSALAIVYMDKKQDADEYRPIYVLTYFTTLLFIGLMIFIWPAAGGIQWGTRYLLLVYPLLVFLAFHVYTTQSHRLVGNFSRIFQWVAAGLLIMSFLVQGYSLFLLQKKLGGKQELLNTIDNLPAELILTNHPFLPSLLATLDKDFLYVDETEDLNILIPRFYESEITQFALINVTRNPVSVPTQVNDIIVSQIEPYLYNLEKSIYSNPNDE